MVTPLAYYNDSEPYAAAWLRNLIEEGLIPHGDVDERDIRTIDPRDLEPYTQCHFFAGLGGWPRALRLAGWPDSRPVWTGSCPCQPFSAAGKRKGFADERHLWPDWLRLIQQRRPAIVFGEQVARAADWLALVRSDLETMGYAVGCMPIEAASVGANHKRDRFWFVAYAHGQGEHASALNAEVACASEPIPDAPLTGLSVPGPQSLGADKLHGGRMPAANSWWAVEPAMGRVAHGIPARVAKLRALGNAIVPQAAAAFVIAADQAIGGLVTW